MKVLKYAICLLALLAFSTSAFSGSGAVEKPGQGEQHCNHNDGDPSPGPGPKSDELTCLSALTTGNPVLILQACGKDFLPDATIQGAGNAEFPGQGAQHHNNKGG